MSGNPVKRKTKKYSQRHQENIFTIDDAREYVIKVKKVEGLSKSSIENYKKTFNDCDRFFGESTDVRTITVQGARDFVFWQLHKKHQFLKSNGKNENRIGVSPTSANTYLTYAKAIFSQLQADKIIDENVFFEVEPVKYQKKIINTFSVNEIKTMRFIYCPKIK